MHEDQLAIPVDVAARAIAAGFPPWADQPVEPLLAEGTVHAIFRVGDAIAVRFPIRPADPGRARRALEAEHGALRELAAHLTTPVPRPLGIGDPPPDYPLPWSAQTWLRGTPAHRPALADSIDLADDVARLIGELRSIPLADRTFERTGRGGDLRHHVDWVTTCLARSEHLLPVDDLRTLWRRMVDLPRRSPDCITHGDLIPGNLLVDDTGRLCGLLDPGSYGAADPALDLIVAWHLFADRAREHLRRRLEPLGYDDLDWERGKAWAFEQSIGLVWYYETTNPIMSRLGRRTLQRLLAVDDRC